ncbi:MAG: hypothetical protein IJ540_06400 [Prevotella sp.]|nr:hypothetical protein [Prevotella sp.]
METSVAWKENTQKIFWGVIVIAVAGIFNVLYDYVSYVVYIFEFVTKFLPSGNNGLGAFFTSIHTLGFLAKVAVVVGYVLYLLGLTRFAAMQTNALAAQNIQKVRTAVIILICCFVAGAIFGILFSIPFLGTLISLAVWIATLVAYFKMKNAFSGLMTSPAFSAMSQVGAKKLHYAAVCNIRLMLMPIAIFLIFGLLALLIVGSMRGGSNPTWLLYIGGFIGIAAIICALVFMFFALVYPFIGWYKIMNGGPGDDTLTDTSELEQRMAAIPTTDERVQALKTQGEKAFASFKESLTPKLEKAKEWTVANKRKVGIGAGCVAVIAFILWLISLLGGNKGIEFETYEVMEGYYQVTIDIPKGDSDREQNITKGLREIIANSELCKEEVVGTPKEGSLHEIIDDCNQRYQKFADYFMKESEAPEPPVCQLYIESVYQNEACVVFQVDDGVYFNGAPETYFRVIRFSDGHIMQTDEMISITPETLEPIVKKYYHGNLPVFLGDGYFVLPAVNDSCRVAWSVNHGYGDVMIPISELESHFTDVGKEIYTAKALSVAIKETIEETEGEQPEQETSSEGNNHSEKSGLLAILPEGTSEYKGEMAGFPIEFSITKTGNSLSAVYRNVKFSATIKLESDAQDDNEGNTTFWGNDAQGNQWRFHLGGNESLVSGYAEGDGKNLQVVLYKK